MTTGGQPTPFDVEARIIGEARAAGGEIRGSTPARIGGNACAIPAVVACECGREIHITVNLGATQIEAAVTRVLADMRRKAYGRPLRLDLRNGG